MAGAYGVVFSESKAALMVCPPIHEEVDRSVNRWNAQYEFTNMGRPR
jgi:hypothetical protein